MRLFVFSLATLIAASGGASAQSVLERVLGRIDNATNLAQVNGTYANIAENVGIAPTSQNAPVDLSTASDDTILWSFGLRDMTIADLGTTFTSGDGSAIGELLVEGDRITLFNDGSLLLEGRGASYPMTGVYGPMILEPDIPVPFPEDALVYTVLGESRLLSESTEYNDFGGGVGWYSPAPDFEAIMIDVTIPGLSPDIDASITNIISGVVDATAEATAEATAAEFTLPTVDLGDMSTTGLGAVNTGDITLGVNSAVDEASTSTTRAIAAVMTLIGGSADTGAIVINVASNAGAINGSINNVLDQVNGSIGNLSTTALGAVNTGTIVSGVDAAVQGIVGMSGQASSGL